MKNRRKARELALQILYQIETRKTSTEEALEVIFSRYRFKPEVREFAETLVRGSHHFILPLNSLIKKYAKNWTLDRMATVDRNILRLAIYELLFLENVPPIVSINEAVEIAKRYGTDDSGKFVNGILDKIRQERESESSLKWHYLKNALQKDPHLKELIELKEKEKLWLVGGCLRNLLLGREKSDLDLITEDSHFRVAELFAQRTRRSLVALGPTLRRVALPEGIFIDFSLKKYPSLEKDLLQRDFSINSLALDLDSLNLPFLFLIDPQTGLEDLMNKKIRLLSKDSFKSDPLRMLRAFRLASHLNFTIEDKITKFVKNKSSLIKEVAEERIGNELFLLLENPLSCGYLESSAAKTLLKQILGRNPNLESLKRLEDILLSKKIINKNLKKKITAHLLEEKGTRIRRDLLKLVTLIFSPRQEKNSLSCIGKDLKLGRKDIETIERIEKLYPFLEKIVENAKKPLDSIPFLIQAEKETVEICLLFLVSHWHQQNSLKLIIQILEEYFQKSDLILHPPGLIKGNDLMEILNIPATPYISYLLDKIHQAQLKEEIKSKEEAIEYVKRLVSEEGEQREIMTKREMNLRISKKRERQQRSELEKS